MKLEGRKRRVACNAKQNADTCAKQKLKMLNILDVMKTDGFVLEVMQNATSLTVDNMPKIKDAERIRPESAVTKQMEITTPAKFSLTKPNNSEVSILIVSVNNYTLQSLESIA